MCINACILRQPTICNSKNFSLHNQKIHNQSYQQKQFPSLDRIHIRLKIITNTFIISLSHSPLLMLLFCLVVVVVVFNDYFLCRVVASIHEASSVPASFAKVLSKSIAYKIFYTFHCFILMPKKQTKQNENTRRMAAI